MLGCLDCFNLLKTKAFKKVRNAYAMNWAFLLMVNLDIGCD